MARGGCWRGADLLRWIGGGLLAVALSGACAPGTDSAPTAASIALIGNFRGFQKPCG